MTDIVESQGNEVSTEMAGWGSETKVSAKDIIIPKILLMQSDSTLVMEDKAKNKDFVNSSSKEVMKDVSYTPIKGVKLYRVFKKEGNKGVFLYEEPWTDANDEKEKEWKEGKDELYAQKVWRFYGLVNGEPMPFVLDLRGMSYSAGKRLYNLMYVQNPVDKLTPGGKTIKLSTSIQEYEGAKKNVFEYTVDGVTPKEVLGKAYEWFKTLQTSTAKVDDAEDEEFVETSASKPVPKTEQQNFDAGDIPF